MIYISGKIGEKTLSEKTIAKFKAAQDRLLDDGWDVVNPVAPKFQEIARKHVDIEAEKWNDTEHGHFEWYDWFLLRDLHVLALCDAIYMLEDWTDSPGAKTEFFFAKACGKQIIMEKYNSQKLQPAISPEESIKIAYTATRHALYALKAIDVTAGVSDIISQYKKILSGLRALKKKAGKPKYIEKNLF